MSTTNRDYFEKSDLPPLAILCKTFEHQCKTIEDQQKPCKDFS